MTKDERRKTKDEIMTGDYFLYPMTKGERRKFDLTAKILVKKLRFQKLGEFCTG